MYLQDIHTPLKIRPVNDHTSVKTSRAEKRRIKNFRSVGSSKDQKTLGSVKTVHLRKELVQCLLTLVISAAIAGITALTDGIDLINKYDTRCILLGFLKKVTDTGCPHTYKHLHKLRSGKGEERHLCLTGNCLCKQCLTGSWRAYKKGTFRQFGSDGCVFSGVMKEIHNFLQRFLGFILTGHILKGNSRLFLHISLGFTLANAHTHDPAAFIHAPHGEHQKTKKKQCRKNHA